jgi:hypothetical protein
MSKITLPGFLPQDDGQNKETPSGVLTLEEKCRMLAAIAQVNLLDYFKEDGSFDVGRAQREMPRGCVQALTVDEVTRADRNGNQTTTRKVRLRLVDRLKALALHNELTTAKEGEADALSGEEKARREKQIREAQELARAILKEKLLGPDWPLGRN